MITSASHTNNDVILVNHNHKVFTEGVQMNGDGMSSDCTYPNSPNYQGNHASLFFFIQEEETLDRLVVSSCLVIFQISCNVRRSGY
ncbi:hypothetical protein MKW98_023389 [Papaver atlanticum]|uniref:Uncharacterized protein n=1 Tax=Papaver atlanticum TaxID=357466 RepID=A0AAD4XMQ7_9MAGN|nr:hypothetical protein MKW98_023389 [Papaver atlanticum]